VEDRIIFKTVKNIVIVGGGTSAWFAAAYLNANFDGTITVVDKEIGSPVGVGEGTLLNFDEFMKACGFRTEEWFDAVGATFKSGILFPNFGGEDNLVWHPFYLNPEYEESESSLYEAYTHHQDLEFNELSAFFLPSIKRSVDTQNLNYYAMHVDCSKLVLWIQEQLQDRVELIKSEVVQIERTACGGVESLETKQGHKISGDLFIDCTGFKQLLQDNADNVSLYGRLFCDTAIATHVPYEDKKHERHPYVVSEATPNGWIWDIPVQDRIGSGYVFNRSISNLEDIKLEFCEYWDHRISPDDCKVIDWTPYYNKNMWDKNVVAVGLSGGFIEPLESSGIAMITNGIIHLCNMIFQGYFTENDVEMYNSIMKATYNETIDFVNMHYAYKPFDSKFWNWVEQTNEYSDLYMHLKENLKQGGKINNEGKGLLFSQANWYCWLLQIEKEIAPTRSLRIEDSSKIIADWLDVMSEAKSKHSVISHDAVLKNAADYLEKKENREFWYES